MGSKSPTAAKSSKKWANGLHRIAFHEKGAADEFGGSLRDNDLAKRNVPQPRMLA
jgi:hypothetical protein